MNAIKSQRLHQAYLMTGSRGIGKTSIARIFSKAVRCGATSWATDQSGAAWMRSCDECTSCREIAAGNSVDVIEIDGASNNGVDAIREIRENAKYLPASGGKKIYIIDEVHMLTTAAFNALLKTLEEPPPHVIFIFATTEPHKIPATILSRCQRFDLRRVTVAQIQTRLTEVTKNEGIEAETGALALISRAAEGSMRDALSLLDQVIAFAGDKLTTQAVRDSVGLIEGQSLLQIIKAVFDRKPLDALAIIDQAYQQGHDLRVLTRSLIELVHAAVLAKIGAPHSSQELSEDEWRELCSIAELRTLEEIELIFQVLHHGIDWIARAPRPRIVLDVLLVKCATAEALISLSDSAPAQATPTAAPATQKPAPKPAAPVQALASVQPSVTPQLQTQAPTPSSVSTEKNWDGFIAKVHESRPLLASLLEHGNCTQYPNKENNQVTACYKPSEAYYRDQLQSKIYTEQLLTQGREYFGFPVRFQIELRDTGESPADRRERERTEREQTIKTAAANHPIICEAKSLFGGDLDPIELTNETGGRK
jgi:DNA polymerase-3 subunit gamma/tau